MRRGGHLPADLPCRGAHLPAAPGLVPDISGPADAGGLTPAAKAETNRIESIDPYVADFLFGALLGGVLAVVSALLARPIRPTNTVAARSS
ncbi:MAG: hypothetical protein ACJ72N_24870 [Labedaea sp.]